MAFLIPLVPTLLGVAGSLDAADKSKKAGQRAQMQKNYQAAQLEQDAGQVRAVAQQEGLQERQKTKLVASRALALTAAGGGGTNDPTIVNIIGDINGEGAYREAVALYQGEENARKLSEGAKFTRLEGEVAERSGKEQARAYQYQAGMYAARGGSSLYSKYGGSQPGTKTTTDDLSSGVGVYV